MIFFNSFSNVTCIEYCIIIMHFNHIIIMLIIIIIRKEKTIKYLIGTSSQSTGTPAALKI